MVSLKLNSTQGRGRLRLLGVAGTVLLTEGLWLLATAVAGIHLQAPAANGNPQQFDIGPLLVAVASIVASLVGWGLIAVLERLTTHARGAWLILALVALAGSLVMPLSGTGVSVANRAVLVLMHLAVAAVLLPVLYRTSVPRTTDAVGRADRLRAIEAG